MGTIEFAVSKPAKAMLATKMSLRQFHDDSPILSDIFPNNRLVWGDHIPVPSSRERSFLKISHASGFCGRVAPTWRLHLATGEMSPRADSFMRPSAPAGKTGLSADARQAGR